MELRPEYKFRRVCTIMCSLAFAVSTFGASIAPAQLAANRDLRSETSLAPPAMLSRTSPASSRAGMYDQLARDAAAVEPQYSLIKQVVRTIAPTVVHIEAKKRSRGSGEERATIIEEAGSGAIIYYRNQFYVVTNHHVVEGAELNDIKIEADGRLFYPTRIARDPASDLAVLFTSRSDLTPSRIGDSDMVEIGDFVVAVGSPFGLSHSVSYGIISAKGRRDLELGPQGVRFQDFFQTDAAINPGNSGGPLVNLRGEVIGINTAIASNSGGNDGIGFSIPIRMAMRIVRDLIDYGEVHRGFLGVSLDARYTPETGREMGIDYSYGTRVSAITPDSPAAEAGFRVGDVILEFNGVKIESDSHLVTVVSLNEIGAEVPARIVRDGRIQTIKVNVRDRSAFSGSRNP